MNTNLATERTGFQEVRSNVNGVHLRPLLRKILYAVSTRKLPLPVEGVNKLEFAPSPYPLPAGERVNPLKLIINFLPLDGGGAGWG
jgi:hypothetical protein